MKSKSWILVVLGVVLTLAGLVWTLQGFNVIGGSVMSGVTLWAIVGPIVGVVGLVLLGIGIGRRRRASS